MLKKTSLLLILITAPLTGIFAQHYCGTDEFAAKDPNAAGLFQALNRQLAETLRTNTGGQKSLYTVPVVFHIVHDNGPENIHDSVIYNAIEQANLRMANAAPYTHPMGHTTNVQLCLASVDPYGNPTTGITRTQSPETVISAFETDEAMKNVSRWDPHLYLNIWIIRQPGLPYGAYSTVPSSAGGADDGIVFMYFGLNGYILNHEVGHYLGLYHTFHWNCDNSDCSLDGDCVCDTPPDITSDGTCMGNSCSTDAADTTGLSPFTTDVDELPNYMDYSSCDQAFTAGQVDRIDAVLNSVRSTLLQSNGCGQHPGGPVPTASFTAESNCFTTTFTNTSSNSVGAQWDFNSDGIIDESGNSVSHWFDTGGNYTVTMYAAGYGGIDTVVQQIMVQVPPNPSYPMSFGHQGILYDGFGGVMYCEGSTVQINGVPGMASYQWSNGDTTQNTTFQPTGTISVSLTAVDTDGLTWTGCAPLIVPVAPAPLLSAEEGPFGWCLGDSVTVNAVFSPHINESAWYYNGSELTGFHDTSFTVILQDTTTFIAYQQHTTGCETWSDTITILAVDCGDLGIESQNLNSLHAYPSPAEDALTLSWSTPEDHLLLTIYQADGKLVHSREILTGTSCSLNVSDWQSGMYYARLQNSTVRFLVK